MQQKTIFHLDMDAFFASIEVVKNPSLAGLPVIVGGRPDSRGVVSTCSYEARKFGVRSAMPLAEAKKRCSQGIFIEGNYALYQKASAAIILLLKQFTEKVEVVSIDEAYLDVTDIIGLYKTPLDLACQMKQAILKKTKLTCSIGIASNKLLAKIGSSSCKPNGLVEIPIGKEAAFLASLPIDTLPGIGIKTKEMFIKEGIKKISDLQQLPLDVLMQRYGSRGYHFFYASQGIDNSPVSWQQTTPKSIGAEITFDRDEVSKQKLLSHLKKLVEKAADRLKSHKMRARSVTLKLRDSEFKTITRSQMLLADTNNFDSLLSEALDLFNKSYDSKKSMRLLGISFHKLSDKCWQPSFFDKDLK